MPWFSTQLIVIRNSKTTRGWVYSISLCLRYKCERREVARLALYEHRWQLNCGSLLHSYLRCLYRLVLCLYTLLQVEQLKVMSPLGEVYTEYPVTSPLVTIRTTNFRLCTTLLFLFWELGFIFESKTIIRAYRLVLMEDVIFCENATQHQDSMLHLYKGLHPKILMKMKLLVSYCCLR